jgi:hypothetical protein
VRQSPETAGVADYGSFSEYAARPVTFSSPGNIMALSAHDVADRRTGAAASECLTDEALSHLKTYRYSSVDLSPLSNYVLRHYVRKLVG